MDPKPDLHDISEFGLSLSVSSATGDKLPYKGFIEADVSVPSLGNNSFIVPVLVVADTEYNSQVPAIIGTNVIRLCKQSNHKTDVPNEWQTAFDSLCDDTIPVRTTNNYGIRLAPGEVKTIHGIVRGTKDIQNAVTEHIEGTLSGNLTICPRVVSLKAHGATVRVPVRVCNLSARAVEIPPKSLLCSLSSVNVVDSWTPDSTQKQEHKSMATSLDDIGIKIDSDNLNADQLLRAKQVLGDWSHIFSTGPTDLGRTDAVKHKINLTDNVPFKDPYRRIPPALYEEVRQHLKEMIEADAIRPSSSPYSSNVVLVRKKDGSLRFCIDFRKLNSRTIKDAYTLPRIDDTIDTLLGAKFFSKLDLRSGYWQVEIDEADKYKTAFTVGNLGFFECNRMAFGLTNAPATFQRLMERCMGEMNLKECLIFLDDILIFSETFEEHISRLEAVFSRLNHHGLKLKASKCEFFKSSVRYLGHVVSEKGVETDPDKIESLISWPQPNNVKELRSFLGFTGYYRRFIKDYARIVKPLNDLLIGHPTNKISDQSKKKKKKKSIAPWQWGNAQQLAFNSLKDKLSSPPVLAYADFTKPFILHTDASCEGLGAVLYQEHDGIEKVIAYASRGLRNSEKLYPAHKLEFLCLKWAVTDKFHDYLYGNTFTVCTDNNPLTYVLTSAKLDATGHRWLASLGSYDFQLKYKSGKSNGDADGLSRRPQQTVQLFPEAVNAICQSYTVQRNTCPYVETLLVSQDDDILDTLSTQSPGSSPASSEFKDINWSREQLADPSIARIISLLKTGFSPEYSDLKTETPTVLKYLREWKKFSLVDGILYRNTVLDGQNARQLVLPAHLRDTVLRHLHDDLGHQGRDRTMSLVRQRFYWPGLESCVEQKIKNCVRCIQRKTVPKPSAELVNIVTTQPMELVCIDFLSLERSKGGHENILVITDHFTRYAQAFPTRNQLAKTVAKVLFEQFIVHYGFPARLHSDQGRNFESSVISELCSLAGVQKSRTTPYHPMGNGMVERFNQTLLNMLGTLQDNQKQDWKSFVAPLVHSYNATKHDSTGYSPFFLMFGRHPRLAVDAYLGLQSPVQPDSSREHYVSKLKKRLNFAYKVAAREAEKSANRSKTNYDLKVREATLDVGDHVLIRNVGLRGKHKLADKWDKHPYVVTGIPDKNVPVYTVQRESGDSTVKTLHRNMLLPFSVIPGISETNIEPDQNVSPEPRKITRKQKAVPISDSDPDSDSDQSDYIPRYIPPHRRNGKTNLPIGVSSRESAERSITINDSSYHDSFDSSVVRPSAAIGRSQLDTAISQESDPLASGGHQSSLGRTLDQSEQSVVGIEQVEQDVGPRRSGRIRQPPNRYGDWQMNQQSVQEWFV
ncbi:MAG: RNase H-like domain-containing protein [Candidatus Thiodiazotropha endolucinida]|nr:RNase H-like domain-containing protein [Candidatus Thiodiazotropha endolucinida]